MFTSILTELPTSPKFIIRDVQITKGTSIRGRVKELFLREGQAARTVSVEVFEELVRPQWPLCSRIGLTRRRASFISNPITKGPRAMYRRTLLPLYSSRHGDAALPARPRPRICPGRRSRWVSNPPVFQDIGFVDTIVSLATEADCRVCHSSGVPNRHHLLYNTTIPPYTVAPFRSSGQTKYNCISCHSQNFTVIRDCKTCHETSPHHSGEDAFERQCTECHGSLVADYDDNHYIPTYPASLVTPKTGLYGAGWHDE